MRTCDKLSLFMTCKIASQLLFFKVLRLMDETFIIYGHLQEFSIKSGRKAIQSHYIYRYQRQIMKQTSYILITLSILRMKNVINTIRTAEDIIDFMRNRTGNLLKDYRNSIS